MKFSSRFRVVAVAFVAALFSLATIFSIEKLYTEPVLNEEHQKRVDDLPLILAITNQNAIIMNDLATLKTTLQQSISAMEHSGVRYIIIEDADGKIIAAVYHSSFKKADIERIHGALKRVAAQKLVGRTEAVVANTTKFSESERSAMEGSAEEKISQAMLIPEGYLPKIEYRKTTMVGEFSEPIIDQAVPITTGAIKFGGLRIGTADELQARIKEIHFITWTTIIMLIVVVGGLGLSFANQIDSKFSRESSEKISEIRSELERRIKQLETEYSRKEEENPVTPSEFLSLLDFARKITGTLDYNEALQIGIHSILQIMGIRDASIFVLDSASNELVGRIGHDENGLVADDEMSQIRVAVGKGDIGAAAEFGTTTTIDTPRPGSAVVSALVSRGRTIGVILVRNKLNGRPFLKKDQTILRIFSGLIANAMETSAIYHHLTNKM